MNNGPQTRATDADPASPIARSLSPVFSPASRTPTWKPVVTCVDAAVPLQLAWLGERLLTGVTLEHSRLLGAQRRAGLVRLRVLLPQTTHGEET